MSIQRTQTIEMDIDLTVEELAEAFWNLSAAQMIEFLNQLADIADFWLWANQMRSIVVCHSGERNYELRNAARSLIACMHEHFEELGGAYVKIGAPVSKVKRMHFDQPSTLQPFHNRNGENVLVEEVGDHYQIHFLEGDTISMPVYDLLCLSKGWREHKN